MEEFDYEYENSLYETIDMLELQAESLQEDVMILEKALNKACEVMVNRVNIDSGYGTPTLRFTKEQWKEWCMKDD